MAAGPGRGRRYAGRAAEARVIAHQLERGAAVSSSATTRTLASSSPGRHAGCQAGSGRRKTPWSRVRISCTSTGCCPARPSKTGLLPSRFHHLPERPIRRRTLPCSSTCRLGLVSVGLRRPAYFVKDVQQRRHKHRQAPRRSAISRQLRADDAGSGSRTRSARSGIPPPGPVRGEEPAIAAAQPNSAPGQTWLTPLPSTGPGSGPAGGAVRKRTARSRSRHRPLMKNRPSSRPRNGSRSLSMFVAEFPYWPAQPRQKGCQARATGRRRSSAPRCPTTISRASAVYIFAQAGLVDVAETRGRVRNTPTQDGQAPTAPMVTQGDAPAGQILEKTCIAPPMAAALARGRSDAAIRPRPRPRVGAEGRPAAAQSASIGITAMSLGQQDPRTTTAHRPSCHQVPFFPSGVCSTIAVETESEGSCPTPVPWTIPTPNAMAAAVSRSSCQHLQPAQSQQLVSHRPQGHAVPVSSPIKEQHE